MAGMQKERQTPACRTRRVCIGSCAAHGSRYSERGFDNIRVIDRQCWIYQRTTRSKLVSQGTVVSVVEVSDAGGNISIVKACVSIRDTQESPNVNQLHVSGLLSETQNTFPFDMQRGNKNSSDSC